MTFSPFRKVALALICLPIFLFLTLSIAGCQASTPLTHTPWPPNTLVPLRTTPPVTLPYENWPVDFTDEHGIHMKLIPAGPFEMGSQAGLALMEC
jgi:hypothetical protein